MTKVVLDTNVTVSAIGFGAKPRQVLDSVFCGSTQLCVSEIISIAEWAEPVEHVHVIQDDPDDNAFLECALASRGECIVSGDPHLLDLKTWSGIRILTPDRYVADFLGQHE